MAFNKDNAKNTLAPGGLPFLPENLEATKQFSMKAGHIVEGKEYFLGRLGVIKGTKRFDQPFVALELDGEFYTGYATALGNQVTNLIDSEIQSGNTVGLVSTNRNSYSEAPAEIKVTFMKGKSDMGEYWSMLFVD